MKNLAYITAAVATMFMIGEAQAKEVAVTLIPEHKTVTINVESQDTAGVVREKVAEATGIPADQRYLTPGAGREDTAVLPWETIEEMYSVQK